MDYKRVLIVSTVVIMLLLSLSTFSVAAQQGDDASDEDSVIGVLELSEDVIGNGESEVTLTFRHRFLGNGTSSSGYIMDIKAKGVSIKNVTTPGSGYWNEKEKKVLFTEPPNSVDVVFEVEEASGGSSEVEKGMNVSVTDGDNFTERAFELSLENELRYVIDENDNYMIDDSEIMEAVSFWVSGDEVPDYGDSISDSEILELIDLWSNNTNFREIGPT